MKPRIKIRKGLITSILLIAVWSPLLVSAANMDKYSNNPAWMDWGFFGSTIISAGLTRWCNKSNDE
ncbi:MAG: hypothetical protein H9917_08730 [Candidatus Oceanisphaera merdipullorum]|nr:hypothetical protein [Candidatus Oceanisphaera merdipullorum]